MKRLILKSVLLSMALFSCSKEESTASQTDLNVSVISTTGRDLKIREAKAFENKVQKKLNDPEFAAKFQENEAFTKRYETLIAEAAKSGKSNLPLRVLNIAVNIIHVDDAPPTRQQVRQQIGILNRAFEGGRTNRSRVPERFRRSIAGDTRIQFDLQRIRYKRIPEPLTDEFDLFFDSTGGMDPINPENTINVYVSTSDEFEFGPFAGAAGLPGLVPPEFDHIVIDFLAFGTETGDIFTNAGETLVHEMGHFLNLHHLPGPGGENVASGCRVDDFVGDTPNTSVLYDLFQDEAILGETTTSCGSQDMFVNFMGDSADSVLEMFTIGQRNRMRATLEPGGSRSNFIQAGS